MTSISAVKQLTSLKPIVNRRQQAPDWPPSPKVLQYGKDDGPIPRVDPPEIKDLKKGNTFAMARSIAYESSEVEINEKKQIKKSLSDMIQPRLNMLEARENKYPVVNIPLKSALKTPTPSVSELASEDSNLYLKSPKSSKKIPDEDSSETKLKKKTRTTHSTRHHPRIGRVALFEYLKKWDTASNIQRKVMLQKFLEDYSSQDPLDLEFYVSKGGSLIFIRFIVGMQMLFHRKKPVAYYFMALGIFIKSLEGERFTYEFGIAGGFQTAFEVLRVSEISNHDKMHVFHFLYTIIDGKGGLATKRYLCSDTSFLECVVDCLTMCQNEYVIREARLFLENLCLGNTTKNLLMISKYIVSLLPCDFNPRLQAMACYLLQGVVHQIPEVAGNCYSLIVDVLKSDFDESLIDVGNVCLSILGTLYVEDLLRDLIEAVQPYNLLENLSAPDNFVMDAIDAASRDESSDLRPRQYDPYMRLQYGAIYVLNYIIKHQTKYAAWMIDFGIIGSLISALGTASYSIVQLESIRLLFVLHELTPDCAIALKAILPTSMFEAFFAEKEDLLHYLTSVNCLVLRRLGVRIQQHWAVWFERVLQSYVPPSPIETDEDVEKEEREDKKKEVKVEVGKVLTAEEKEASDNEEELLEEKAEVESKEEEENLMEKLKKARMMQEQEKEVKVEVPKSEELEDEDEEQPVDIFYELDTLLRLLEQSITEPYMKIVDKMKLILPDDQILGHKQSAASTGSTRRDMDKLTLGDQYIQVNEDLESFRKYIGKDVIEERVDEFEKYYAAKFIMAGEDTDEKMLEMKIKETNQLLREDESTPHTTSLKDPFITANEEKSQSTQPLSGSEVDELFKM